jgi:dipeptidyl-peptidase 4
MLINALVAANKPFTMMEYPNRTHCICQGRNTQAHLFGLITDYLEQNLKNGLAPGVSSSERAAAGGR